MLELYTWLVMGGDVRNFIVLPVVGDENTANHYDTSALGTEHSVAASRVSQAALRSPRPSSARSAPPSSKPRSRRGARGAGIRL